MICSFCSCIRDTPDMMTFQGQLSGMCSIIPPIRAAGKLARRWRCSAGSRRTMATAPPTATSSNNSFFIATPPRYRDRMKTVWTTVAMFEKSRSARSAVRQPAQSAVFPFSALRLQIPQSAARIAATLDWRLVACLTGFCPTYALLGIDTRGSRAVEPGRS